MRDCVPRARAREREVARGSRAGRVRGAAAARSRTSISVHVDFFRFRVVTVVTAVTAVTAVSAVTSVTGRALVRENIWCYW